MAGADSATEEKLGDFAWNLGMAFQLVDDLLDFTAREQSSGKPVGSDLREGKVTLPLVYALENATGRERKSRYSDRARRDRTYDRVPFQEVRHMIQNYGAAERVQESAHQFTAKSRQLINEFPDSPYQMHFTL